MLPCRWPLVCRLLLGRHGVASKLEIRNRTSVFSPQATWKTVWLHLTAVETNFRSIRVRDYSDLTMPSCVMLMAKTPVCKWSIFKKSAITVIYRSVVDVSYAIDYGIHICQALHRRLLMVSLPYLNAFLESAQNCALAQFFDSRILSIVATLRADP